MSPSTPNVGLSCPFTFFAIQGLADELPPAFLRQDPWPADQRRMVPYVLAVPAREIGNPIAVLIQVKTDDGLIHDLQLTW